MNSEEKELLIECIPSGRENAVTAGAIANRAGINRKTASKKLFQLMCDGEWVAVVFENDTPMFYLPDSREGFTDAFTHLRERELGLRRRLKVVKAYRRKMQEAIESRRGGKRNETHDSNG